jgi:hypothetical protein
MNKVQKTSVSECNKPSSQPLRFYSSEGCTGAEEYPDKLRDNFLVVNDFAPCNYLVQTPETRLQSYRYSNLHLS